jgi:hypothetical protein
MRSSERGGFEKFANLIRRTFAPTRLEFEVEPTVRHIPSARSRVTRGFERIANLIGRTFDPTRAGVELEPTDRRAPGREVSRSW